MIQGVDHFDNGTEDTVKYRNKIITYINFETN